MNKLTKYKEWLNFGNLDKELRMELNTLTEEKIEKSFSTDLKFGTGGIRTLIGCGTNRLNIYTIRKITEGYACWIKDQSDNEGGIVIGYDNRKNSQRFAEEASRVLIKHHIKVYLFDSLRPTPEISFAIRHLHAFGGIVITASHNSQEYNGYKIYDYTGCQCVSRYTKQIANYIGSVENELDIETCTESEFKENICILDKIIDDLYYESVANVQLNPSQRKDLVKIVYSAQHGTGNIPVMEVLKRAGYNAISVPSQSYPSETFENTENPNPEHYDAFEEGIKFAEDIHSDVIFSTDPDADRLGVMIRSDDKFKLLSGNALGIILLNYILEQKKNKGQLSNNAVVVNTIVTSTLGDKLCDKYGVKIEKTLTGFKYIGQKIEQYSKEEETDFLFGYEESCGYLAGDSIRDKDGIQACLLTAEVVNYYKNLNMDLFDVLRELYDEFGYYEDSQKTIPLDSITGDIHYQIEQIKEKLISTNKIIIREEDYSKSLVKEFGRTTRLTLPKSEVIKIIYDDGSWVAIRPSGTEPKIKVYYCILKKGECQ